MGNYFEGFSLRLTAVLLMMTLMLWALSSQAAEYLSITSKTLIPFACCLVAFALIEFVCFFAFAASLSLIAGTLTGLASFKLRRMTHA